MQKKITIAAAISIATMGLTGTAQATVNASLTFDTPLATIASNADIPVYLTLALDPSSDPITTDSSGYVTSPIPPQAVSDLNGNSTGVVVNEEASCGNSLDACNPAGKPYTFSFNFGANNFVTPANLNLQPGDSLDFLLGTFTPNGGNAPAGVYDFSSADINFQYYDATSGQTYFSNIATTYNSFERVVFAAAVPEPATWAMLLIGMGAVGAGLRTRRKKGMLIA